MLTVLLLAGLPVPAVIPAVFVSTVLAVATLLVVGPRLTNAGRRSAALRLRAGTNFENIMHI
jgi:hypothetical protein